jgi:two-component system, chemotaxis family, CheB/CheR fusion protein
MEYQGGLIFMKRTAKQKKPEIKTQIIQVKSLKNNNSPSRKETQDMPKEFPIAGIGASAGGLEALELFLRNVSGNSGMAFVIVQHLDPTYKGIMPELLQRITKIRVVQVKDRLRVKPDCIYAISPNGHDLSLHKKNTVYRQIECRSDLRIINSNSYSEEKGHEL